MCESTKQSRQAHPLQSLLEAGRLGDLTDGQLLARFLAGADNPDLAETAFALLVERHGPMVFRVCHSVTRDAHDAEDAFQATFLVLVRKARRLNVRVTLAPWLHEVARKVSLHARADRVRRCRNEKSLARSFWTRPTALANGPTAPEREELDGLVHAEVARLPQRYRDCLILCDLEGCTYEQAAQTLELPLGTVQSRLARARKRLHDRFSRIGLRPSRPGRTGDTLVIGVPSAKVVPPIALSKTTVAKCLHVATDESAGLKFLSGSIATLVQSASRSTVGSGAMFAGVALFPVVLLTGLAVCSQGPSPPRSALNQERVTPSPQSPVFEQSPQASLIPAPRDLRVESGKGKILIYELTADGKRVPMRQESFQGPQAKEIRRQLSWVVMTGVVGHKTIAENLARAGIGQTALETSRHPAGMIGMLKNIPRSEIARPARPGWSYRAIDLERQQRKPDGSWSEWSFVNPETNLAILDNLPELEEELIPPEFRLEALVDPLPLLIDGKWQGVNHPVFIAEALRPVKRLVEPVRPGEVPEVHVPAHMSRTFDFSVSPGGTYRYRARLVLLRPRRPGGRFDWFGEWSEPTSPVTVP